MRYTDYNVYEIARAADRYKLRVTIKKLAEHGYIALGEVYFIPAELTGINEDQYAQIMAKDDVEEE